MVNDRVRVTAVVRSKDREKTIGATITSVMEQSVPSDVLVVDSGSTDRTVEIARSLGARVVSIPGESFSYGRAINVGVEAASADFVLLLSAHCELPSARWVAEALEHFEDPTVAALNGVSSGRDTDAELTRSHPESAVELAVVDRFAVQTTAWHSFWGFSNHASLLRRSVAVDQPFDESMTACEDKEWANRVVADGHRIVYAADLGVSGLHRRREGMRALYRRAEKESRALSVLAGRPAWSWQDAVSGGTRIFASRAGVRRWAPLRPANLVENAGRLAGARRLRSPAGRGDRAERLETTLAPYLVGSVDLVNFPLHNNCGDGAIWLGQRRLIDALATVTRVRSFSGVLGQFEVRDPADTVLVRGGGYFGDVWPQEFATVFDACAAYRGRHLVIGPQTMGRLSAEMVVETRRAFSTMQSVTLSVRDRRSLALAQDLFPECDVLLLPDTAHCLSRTQLTSLARLTRASGVPRIIARNDAEADSSLYRAAHTRGLPVADFVDGRDDPLAAAFRRVHEVIRARAPRGAAGAVLMRGLPASPAYDWHARRELRRAVRLLAPASLIITDRLHAAILGSILEIPVVAVDTGYGKLRGYFEAWPSEYVELVDDAETAVTRHDES